MRKSKSAFPSEPALPAGADAELGITSSAAWRGTGPRGQLGPGEPIGRVVPDPERHADGADGSSARTRGGSQPRGDGRRTARRGRAAGATTAGCRSSAGTSGGARRPNLTLNATVNPDFSQVESDASQFQFDPRQALFFTEKRPFFLDGIEFFTTPNNLVYSRPRGRACPRSQAHRQVRRHHRRGDVGSGRRRTVGERRGPSLLQLVRLQRDVGGQSRAGFVYTDKIDGDTSNRVAGADARVVWRNVYSLDLQGAVSRDVRGGRGVTAPLWQATINRTGRRYGFRYSLRGVDDEFRSASGFINRTGIAAGNATNQITMQEAGRAVRALDRRRVLDGTWLMRRLRRRPRRAGSQSST